MGTRAEVNVGVLFSFSASSSPGKKKMFPHLHLNFLNFSGNWNKHFQFFMYFIGIPTKMDHIFLRDLSRTLLPLMEILPIFKPLIQFSI